jgi:hypothetical protein
MVPVCLYLKNHHYHVVLAVVAGALVYGLTWLALGGLRHTRLWRTALRPRPCANAVP